eukprot:754089-Lingulodinium_polyedra.AAC.1
MRQHSPWKETNRQQPFWKTAEIRRPKRMQTWVGGAMGLIHSPSIVVSICLRGRLRGPIEGPFDQRRQA